MYQRGNLTLLPTVRKFGRVSKAKRRKFAQWGSPARRGRVLTCPRKALAYPRQGPHGSQGRAVNRSRRGPREAAPTAFAAARIQLRTTAVAGSGVRLAKLVA